jgi:hypothetical protein
MESTAPTLLLHAGWRDYARIALYNLTPGGYHPQSSPLAAQDGVGAEGQQEGGEEDEEEEEDEGINNEFAKEYAALPALSWEERVILGDFVAIALLWFLRDPKGACLP